MPKREHPLERVLYEDKRFWEFFLKFHKFFDNPKKEFPYKLDLVIVDPCDLAAIFYYCYENKNSPARGNLMEVLDLTKLHKRGLEPVSETLAEHLERSFNLAMEELRIDEYADQKSADQNNPDDSPKGETNFESEPDDSKFERSPEYGGVDTIARVKSKLTHTQTETASYFGVSRRTIYNWIKKGDLNEVNKRIPADSILGLLNTKKSSE